MINKPNLAFNIIKLTRFTTNFNNKYIKIIILIFNYLKKTKNKDLNYYKSNKNNNSFINNYCNTNYTKNITNYKLINNYVFYFANRFINWKFKLQSIVTQNTIKAKYIAISYTAKKAIYIRNLLKNLSLYKQNKFSLYTNNNKVLLLTENSIFYKKTKHIAIKYHYIKDLINKKILNLFYISTKN